MHPSYFQILSAQEDNPGRELSLSSEVSEWLFFTNFGDEFNQTYDTEFAQYEDDVLPADLAPKAIEGLHRLLANVRLQPAKGVRFRYGWNDSGEELYCSAENGAIIESLVLLISLIEQASALNSDVYCQL